MQKTGPRSEKTTMATGSVVLWALSCLGPHLVCNREKHYVVAKPPSVGSVTSSGKQVL